VLAICWFQIVPDSSGYSVKRILPRGLFGRALIIIIAPIVLLQAIIAYVFFERDLESTTRRLARDVAADINLLVALEDNYHGDERIKLRLLSERQLQYGIKFLPGVKVAPPSEPAVSTIDVALDDFLAERVREGRHFFTSKSAPKCMTAPWRCWCRATASPCPSPIFSSFTWWCRHFC